ncbi:Exonuclease [Thermomonospora echinospora]|uniref:Exonuclease n=1 Tax=Thermomonospora echinospora TaxID=1992 RepID=A0A1H6E8W5_9ACTN|nr:3'-5' exonuclease [Thermomonospora echinospora]SEG94152.1 Exonuclease [Thermomonospora echinospora]
MNDFPMLSPLAILYRRHRKRNLWASIGGILGSTRTASEWAATVLADPDTVILDTETTNLVNAYAVQIAVMAVDGTLLLDTLLNPETPISAGATDIHGITDADVADAPTFTDIADRLTEALDGRRVVIYNREFDKDVLRRELDRHHRRTDLADAPDSLRKAHPATQAWMRRPRAWECAMEQYAAWWGDWSSHWGNFTWQRLGGEHNAAGDCRAVLARLYDMSTHPDGPTSNHPSPRRAGRGRTTHAPAQDTRGVNAMTPPSPIADCPDCRRSMSTGMRQPHYDHVHVVEDLPRDCRSDSRTIVRGYAVGFAGTRGFPQTWIFFADLEPAIVFGRAARMSAYDINSYGVYEAAHDTFVDQSLNRNVATLHLKAGTDLRDHDTERPILERWIQGCHPQSAYYEAE